MKPINVYALTRIPDQKCMQKAERQMSGRLHSLPIRDWEIAGLKKVVEHLMPEMEHAEDLKFYYSFQIPRLGKEFDLLRISEEVIVSVELKSEVVTDVRIAKQLQQNRYYLSMLRKPMRFYTYISSADRLVRMSNKGKLVEAEWSELAEDLSRQTTLYEDHIEALFKSEEYIISPLFHPDRFLRREYFLTSQQKDIQRRILKQIVEEERSADKTAGMSLETPGDVSANRSAGMPLETPGDVSANRSAGMLIGISGLPGTGKSLLLYDLAMTLSEKRRIALIHCGEPQEELKQLDLRMRRVDIIQQEACEAKIDRRQHTAILVDEAHLLSREASAYIRTCQKATGIPVILAYDQEDVISELEMDKTVIRELEQSQAFVRYRLTNRIRSNSELSSFTLNLMHPIGGNQRKNYPNISICYANDAEEAERLLDINRRAGDVCLSDDGRTDREGRKLQRECDQLALILDERYWYDEHHYLRCKGEDQETRRLFHNLNRAKKMITIIVCGNLKMLSTLLGIVENDNEQGKNHK